MEEIINRVEKSGIITLDLENYMELEVPRKSIDLNDLLFQGMILREKDLREFVKEFDWTQFKDCYVHIYCSTNALIPKWAYMLLTSHATPFALDVVCGDSHTLNNYIFTKNIEGIDFKEFNDKRVILKGCGDFEISEYCYGVLTKNLQKHCKSIMFGEACSSVPVFKKKK